MTWLILVSTTARFCSVILERWLEKKTVCIQIMHELFPCSTDSSALLLAELELTFICHVQTSLWPLKKRNANASIRKSTRTLIKGDDILSSPSVGFFHESSRGFSVTQVPYSAWNPILV